MSNDEVRLRNLERLLELLATQVTQLELQITVIEQTILKLGGS